MYWRISGARMDSGVGTITTTVLVISGEIPHT